MMRIINKDDLTQIFYEFANENQRELTEFTNLIKDTKQILDNIKEKIEIRRESKCLKYKPDTISTKIKGFNKDKVMNMYYLGCKGMINSQLYDKINFIQTQIESIRVLEDEFAKKCIVTQHSKENIKRCMQENFLNLKGEMVRNIVEFNKLISRNNVI